MKSGRKISTILKIVPLLFGLALAGCATGANKKADRSAAMTEQVQPGAGAWSEHALRLPKNSPIVITAQLDQLLMSLDDAWDWIVAEPSMLGESGGSIVAFLQAERRGLIGAEGMDPLTPEAWIDLGIDVTRKLYMGAYPVNDEDSRAVRESVDRTLRAQVGLDDEESIEKAVAAAGVLSGEEPLRIYNDVKQETDQLDPLAGFRMIVPLADAETFTSSLERFLSDLQLEPVEPTESIAGQADTVRVFLSKSGEFQAILVRIRGDTAAVDFIYESMGAQSPEMDSESAEEDALRRVERVVEAFPYGRPTAPAPIGEPIAGIAIDQEGTAEFALMRGIRQALSAARGAGLDKRDSLFTYNLFRAYESAKAWTVASNRLTGLSYGIFVGEPGRLFRLGVDLFGAGLEEPLPVSSPAAGIGLEERSIAASIDLEPMVDEAWQDWIGVENPLSAIDNFDAVDFDTTLFALSLPRSLAILFTNAEKVFEDQLPSWAEPLYEQREFLARLDVGSAGLNIGGMRLTPRIVGVLSLDSGLDDETVTGLSESMAAALANLSDEAGIVQRSAPQPKAEGAPEADRDDEVPPGEGPPTLAQPRPEPNDGEAADDSGPKPEPLEAGELQPLVVDGQPRDTVQYYWRVDGDEPYLFFSYGLGADAAEREHAGIENNTGVEGEKIMLFRSEPVALFSLMTFYQPDLFEPLDVGILAQRIGALSFEVTPEFEGGVQRIRYDLVVGAPTEIDGGSTPAN
ncbi:MAG: hypothetical protein ACQEVA_00230 [Myxococcota bacterium]